MALHSINIISVQKRFILTQRMWLCTYIYMYVCTYVYMCVSVCMCMCQYMCTHMHMYILNDRLRILSTWVYNPNYSPALEDRFWTQNLPCPQQRAASCISSHIHLFFFLLCLHRFLCFCNMSCSHEAEHVSSAALGHVTSNTLPRLSDSCLGDSSMCLGAVVTDDVRTESLIFLLTASALPGFQVPNHRCCTIRIPVIHLCTIFYQFHEMLLPWHRQKAKFQKVQRSCFGFIGESAISNVRFVKIRVRAPMRRTGESGSLAKEGLKKKTQRVNKRTGHVKLNPLLWWWFKKLAYLEISAVISLLKSQEDKWQLW